MDQKGRHRKIEKLLLMAMVAWKRLYDTPRPTTAAVPHRKPGGLLRAAARIRAGLSDGAATPADADALEQAAAWERRALWTERKLRWINSILQALYREDEGENREAELAAFHGTKRMAKRDAPGSTAESHRIMNRGLRDRAGRRGKSEMSAWLELANKRVLSFRQICRAEGLEHLAPAWAQEAPPVRDVALDDVRVDSGEASANETSAVMTPNPRGGGYTM
jgi:hypothetical protein